MLCCTQFTHSNVPTITGFSLFNLVFWHTLIIVRIYVIENKLDSVSFNHKNFQR